ncbi:type II toxin-antitoxin system antitoxin SocA domain-containing protein [uncultured Bifidobacterium sp.]|uniref:Panacea domain-containing protein n=1 Tax=uncultured Bifidobacterium sp. TaxID=165187 RepID=UPI002603D874|nr:type II toxin-antitoxin system antitoxin SocA domain-containing protein [uncultured Bifidobacterium sp.]
MTSIINVASYILWRYGSMTTMKLQKLAYYSQAESLSTTGSPLFEEDFQAWRGGPVCYDLYVQHRRMFIIRPEDVDADKRLSSALSAGESAIVNRVGEALSKLTGNELSERTHRENPWREARSGLAPSESGTRVISKDDIERYYRVNPVLPDRS